MARYTEGMRVWLAMLGLLGCVGCDSATPLIADTWPWEGLTPLRYAQVPADLRVDGHDESVGLLHPGAEVWVHGERAGRWLIASPWDGILQDPEPCLTVAKADVAVRPPDTLPPLPPLKGEVAIHQLSHLGPLSWGEDALNRSPLRSACSPLFIDEVTGQGRRHIRQRIGRFELSAWADMSSLAHRVGWFPCAARHVRSQKSRMVLVDRFGHERDVEIIPPGFVPVSTEAADLEAPARVVFMVLRDDGELACETWRWSKATAHDGSTGHVLAAAEPVAGETWHWAYGYFYDPATRNVGLTGPYSQRGEGELFDGYKCAEDLGVVATRPDRYLMVRGRAGKGVIAYGEADLETWYRSPEACEAELPAARRTLVADPSGAMALGARRCAHVMRNEPIPAWLSHLPVRRTH